MSADAVARQRVRTAKVKVAEVTDCKSCHTKLTADWSLTPDALEKFQRSGGK